MRTSCPPARQGRSASCWPQPALRAGGGARPHGGPAGAGKAPIPSYRTPLGRGAIRKAWQSGRRPRRLPGQQLYLKMRTLHTMVFYASRCSAHVAGLIPPHSPRGEAQARHTAGRRRQPGTVQGAARRGAQVAAGSHSRSVDVLSGASAGIAARCGSFDSFELEAARFAL